MLCLCAWILLIMDSYSAMSTTTLLTSHLAGEYYNGKSHSSGLIAAQTMTL